MKPVMAYQTEDGKLFNSVQEAFEYEAATSVLVDIDAFIKVHQIPDPTSVKNLIMRWELAKKIKRRNMTIESIGCSQRTFACLKAINVNTVEELLQYSETGLLSAPNLGRKALNEIKEILSSNGWYLSAVTNK